MFTQVLFSLMHMATEYSNLALKLKYIIELSATNMAAQLRLVKLMLKISFCTSAQTSQGRVAFAPGECQKSEWTVYRMQCIYWSLHIEYSDQ